MLRFQHGFPGELTEEQPLPNAGRTSPLVSRPNQCIQRKAERNRSRRVTGKIISLPVFFRPWKRRTQSANLRGQTPVPKSRYVTKQILHKHRKTRISTQSVSHWRERTKKWRRTDCQVFNSPPQLTKSLPRTGRGPVENPIFFSCGGFARQVSRLFGTSRADRSSCFSKPQVDSLLQNCLVAKVPKAYSLRLQSVPISCNSKVVSAFGLRSSY